MASTASNARTTGAPMPYVGSRISLISKSAIRYVGTLYTIDTKESTVALKDVKSYGTEGRQREGGPVEPSDRIYSYIVFRGPDILDLQFLNTNSVPQSPPAQKPVTSQSVAPQPIAPQQVPPQSVLPQPVQPHAVSQQVASAYQPPVQRQSAPAVQVENHRQSPVLRSQPAPPPVQEPLRQPRPAARAVPEPKRFPLRGPTPRAWGPPPSAPQRDPEVAPVVVAAPKASEPNGVAEMNGNAVAHGRANDVRPRDQGRPRQRGRGRAGQGGRHGGNAGWRRGPGITIPEEDFDFESMHEKFDKASIAESFAAGNGQPNGNANGDAKAFPQATLLYDKSKSFFDELVPEKEMRPERINAAQRRATDFETFGETGPGYRPGFRNAKGRRGRGRGRGRGGRSTANGGRAGGVRHEARQEGR